MMESYPKKAGNVAGAPALFGMLSEQAVPKFYMNQRSAA